MMSFTTNFLTALLLSVMNAPLGGARLLRSLQEDTGMPSISRWMFGAKYSPGSNLTAAIDSFEQILKACPGYDTAGYGYALPGSSSYFDLTLFVDSADNETTVAQAGCMVNYTTTLGEGVLASATSASDVSKTVTDDATLLYNLLGSLVDGAEISISLESTYLNMEDPSVTEGDLMESHFVRFRDDAQKGWFAQRANNFLDNAKAATKGLGETATNLTIAGGATQFPQSFLTMYPNDVHFAAMINHGGSNFESVAKMSRYMIVNHAMTGNYFVPGRDDLTVLETTSILFEAEMFD